MNYVKALLIRIRNRMIKKNENWLALMCGPPGSGKSYSAISMANAITPNKFTIKRNVCFSIRQLLEILNNPKNIRPGDIFVFDEAGIDIDSRNWHSASNMAINHVLQTFRNMNVGIMFTTPDKTFVDKKAQKLFNNYFETVKKDERAGLCYIKPFNIQNNSRTGKAYTKFPRFFDEKGRLVSLSMIKIPKPPQELIDEYEAIKLKFTRKLNKDALKRVIDEENKIKKSHKCTWKYRSRTQDWICQRCAAKRKTNPFND